MKRRLSLLLAAVILAACAPPFAGQAPGQGPTTQATQVAGQPVQSPTAEEAVPVDTQPAPAPTDTQPTIESAQPTAELPAETPSVAEATATTDSGPRAASPRPIPATGSVDDPARIAATEPAPRDQVGLVEAFKKTGPIPRVARTTPLNVKVGDAEPFWVADTLNDTNYIVTATLRYAGPVVLMYVDNTAQVDQADIERSAKAFEERIYPRNQALFGQELFPGIDGDPRLTILNTTVSGAGGYFSSADIVPRAVNRFSNEREMFVIGIDSYPIGTDAYALTLAHEFQHMIEARQGPQSPSWFNEGMSELAQDLNGYVENGAAEIYLRNPDVQLTGWSNDAAQSGEHYGTSQLFMRYFHEQYAGDRGIAELIRDDAGNDPEVFARMAARKRPEIKTFADLYADWAVANYLNDPTLAGGRYAYKLLPGRAATRQPQRGQATGTVNQFGADYLGVMEGPRTLTFDGGDTIGLTGGRPANGRAMWWSKRGDESVSTLTRAFDLTGVQKATLQFSTWYEIELNWDYAFVTVSTDEGKTWTTLPGKTTTNEDPQGQNLGNGLTGVSGRPGIEPEKGERGRWIEEQMDLSPFAGKRILVRFWLVQDAAYNAQGLLIDNIRIPELRYRDDAENGDGGWQAQGFVRTTGELLQEWRLRLIRRAGGKNAVETVPVDRQGRATVRLGRGEQGVLVVMGTTPFTSERANYTYTTATR